MALTDTAVKQAKPADKPIKLTDEKGLHLLINPNGSRYWRFSYRFDGKQKTLALGVYPDTSLKLARTKRDEARQALATGTDPSSLRKEVKQAKIEAVQQEAQKSAQTFEAMARYWLENVHKNNVSEAQYAKNVRRCELYLFTKLANKQIQEIDYKTMFEVLKAIEITGKVETAHRVKWLAGAVFDQAIKLGLINSNPSRLVTELSPKIVKNHRAITDPSALAGLLRSIWSYSGTVIVCAALKVSVYLPQRPGEIRQMRWEDIDIEAGTWSFTLSKAHKSKPKKDLFIDLPAQVIEILREMHSLTSKSDYVFHSARSVKRPMSNNAIRSALINMGYGDEHSAHGFRATLRTMSDEILSQPFSVIETQLGHAVADSNGTAYNRTSYRKQRKDLLQTWANYVDSLRFS